MIKFKDAPDMPNGMRYSSVLDTLLKRNLSEIADAESSNGYRYTHSETESVSFYMSTDHSMHDDMSMVNDEKSPSDCHETKTPISRCEQLQILLARNYYTAPACLLEFINTNSSICYSRSIRDSENTIAEGETDPATDCFLDTNDNLLQHLDGNTSVIPCLSSERTTNRTQIMDNECSSSCQTHGASCMDVDSPLEKILKALDMEKDSQIDRTHSDNEKVNGLYNGGEGTISQTNNEIERPQNTHIDASTSPIYCDFGGSNPTEIHDDGEESAVGCVISGDDTAEAVTHHSSSSVETDKSEHENTLSSCGEYHKEDKENPQNLPVYCRSLLYRIRVPLSQRLKNCYGGSSTASFNTPRLEGSRANLSCDRLNVSPLPSSSKIMRSDFSLDGDSCPAIETSDLRPEENSEVSSESFSFLKNPRNLDYENSINSSGTTRPDRKIHPPGILIAGKLFKPGKLVILGKIKYKGLSSFKNEIKTNKSLKKMLMRRLISDIGKSNP